MTDASSTLPLIKVLAAVLDRLVTSNTPNNNGNTPAGAQGNINNDANTPPLPPNAQQAAQQPITRFHALKPPSISVLSYLERINKYASCSGEAFVLALIYIDRLIQRNNFLLTSLNIHRVIITSVMLAAKFFDDQYFNNAYYAKVGGVPGGEMNCLEVEFLFRVS